MVTSERSTACSFLFLAASFGLGLRSLAKTSYASHGEAQGLLRHEPFLGPVHPPPAA